uniref:chromosomal replication initiator protein DnaA n=1 Tax=[Clostridium] colinum TaxID=36835 RepID=UPI0020258B6E|nr:chromosomal replication initiator protein DnaA [[Clostridium] colinum]
MNTYEDCWGECLKSMQQELGDFAFKTWFGDLQFISFENNTLILKSSDTFYIEHIKLKYMPVLTAVCEQCFNKKNIIIRLVLEEDLKDIFNEPKKKNAENNLNNNYIFENFVIGESNRLAHAASVAVAESPGIYNPLFLYGDVGLGKTHLMHAIANYILVKNPDTKVLYASCEKFTNELIASIREQKNKEFREKYRKIDVLLIDDIQFIVDKTQTQEEFFHTFNDLKDSGKQIIISSDRPPNEIETLTERLRSRFAGGLIADIKTPNFETRTAILEKKAESLNITIPKEVSQFIAKSVKSNIRELEGALTRVIAYSNLTGVSLSIELAENALKDIIQDKDVSLSTQSILEAVSNHFNVKIEEIKSKKRNQPITNARQVYMYLTRELLNESLLNIGKSIDRDHSTVIHGIEKIEEKIKKDKNFEASLVTLKDKILKK